jgi:hypothetical protein
LSRFLSLTSVALLAFVPMLAVPAGPAELDELEDVVVTGEQPGPGLWKVSKGDHVMWVLASHSPLPKDMTWRSKTIEARIIESQEVLYAGGVNLAPDISLLRGLTLIPAAVKAGKIPDKKTLKDVLPADTYGKWLALRRKYMGKDDDVERHRPSIALGELQGAALNRSGLDGGPNVFEFVGAIRKKHRIHATRLPEIKRTIKVEDPRGMLKSAQKLQLPDVDCFTRGLDQVEPEIERARTIANAWARGDVARLRSMHRNLRLKDAIRENCAYTLIAAVNDGASQDAAHMKKMLADMEWHLEQAITQSQRDWVAAAQKSIEKNRSTFAVLGLAEVFSPDGHLQKLRELGYTVEEPLQ